MKFRKKPVVIEAIQWNGNNEIEIMNFMGRKLQYSKPPNRFEHLNEVENSMVTITIPTLEDGKNGQAKHVADRFDWIIKGIHGEFYPCKPDIFEKTYEKIEG